jgi:hypothetical protein
MRAVLVSLVAIAGFASTAQAQAPETAPTPAPMTSPAAAAPAPMASPTPAPAAPMAQPPAGASEAPAAPAPAAETPPAAPAAETPPAPPPPPPPPTDPAAIALLNAVQQVCMPAVETGNLAQAAKAGGFRKSGDNYVYKQPTFQFTILALGSNPHQCHIDIVHPIYPDGPARPLVVALHNWAVFGHDWDLYQNDKSVDAGQEFSIRSWEHTEGDTKKALVITTVRKADGTPTQHNADTSMVLYSENKN